MKIIIVDDDNLVSISLKTILEATGTVEVIAIGRDGFEAVSLYETHRPDILLMDIRMQGMNGLEAAGEIIKKHPSAKILLLTTFSDDEYIIKAIQLGAKGYILKQDFDSIAPAINAVYNGQTVFGTEIIEKLPVLFKRAVTGQTLTDNTGADSSSRSYEEFDLNEKEFGIIQLVSDGLNNKEIAEQLFLSEGTVRNYISVILEKLELRDRTQLACFYYKNLA